MFLLLAGDDSHMFPPTSRRLFIPAHYESLYIYYNVGISEYKKQFVSCYNPEVQTLLWTPISMACINYGVYG